MTPGARIAAAITVLDCILAGDQAERALTNWARASRFAGSKDRASVRDHVYDALRAKRSLAARSAAMTGRGLMIGLALRDDLEIDALFNGAGHAAAPLTPEERRAIATAVPPQGAAAHDLPDWLWPLWQDSLGDQAATAALAQQARADLFLRVNLRHGSRDAAAALLAQDDITAIPHEAVASALRVTGNPRRVAQSRAYAQGHVELQDAASQFAIAAAPVPAGARLLDYCAGGGGKALGFADQHDVAVFAHDIAPKRMADLPARAARAGVTITPLATDALADAGPFDVVFCDAPCTGSGTWRRAPDAKWRLSQSDLDELSQIQANVLRDAAALTAQDGLLIYATCSVLTIENDAIISCFLAENPGWAAGFLHRLVPCADNDGFYLCGLKRPSAP